MCTSQEVFPVYIQLEQDTPILGEDDNVSKNFRPHKDNKLEEQNIEADHRNLIGESLDTGSRAKDGLSRRTPQDGLLISESSASLGEVRFSEQVFLAGKPVSNIRYLHLCFQNDNSCHPFNDQLDYALATYFAESEITKSNVDRFLYNPLMAPLTKKLSYQNADKWMKKLSDIP